MKSSLHSLIPFLPFLLNHLRLPNLSILCCQTSYPGRLASRDSTNSNVNVKVIEALRLEVYRQSFRLGVKPLRHPRQDFFYQLNPCGNRTYVTSTLTWRRVCILWIGFAVVKCTYRTYSMLLKILSFALHTSHLSVQALQSRSCLPYVSHATTAA
jgi:hypothetical protein